MDQLSYESFGLDGSGEARTRGGGRDSLLLGAQMRVNGTDPQLVRVRNLSRGGLMAELAGDLQLGDPVQIEVRGIGWVDGQIAWAAEGRVGISFQKPIDPKRARKPVGVKPAKG